MEAIILRRNYPVPVTLADLRRAALDNMKGCPWWSTSWHRASKTNPPLAKRVRLWWHAALKEATGATDDVYAVIDGREVHVACVRHDGVEAVAALGWGYDFADLLETADEAGYWERPHEVRIDLQEHIPTKRAIGEVVQRSLIEAEVRRGH